MKLIHKVDSFYKLSYIKKIKDKYRVVSKKNKNLGTFDTLEEAKKRLRQIEYFKNASINISKADDFTYSAIMRLFRKHLSTKEIRIFQELYRKNFEKNYLNDEEFLEKNTLIETLLELKEELDLKLDIEKKANLDQLGNPEDVGRYLANIVKFTMRRIKPETRRLSLLKLRKKIYFLNEREIAEKKMPASSAMGNSITFIKHILFNQKAEYIREVLNNIAKYI